MQPARSQHNSSAAVRRGVSSELNAVPAIANRIQIACGHVPGARARASGCQHAVAGRLREAPRPWGFAENPVRALRRTPSRIRFKRRPLRRTHISDSVSV